MRRIDIAGERRKRITHIGNLEIVALLDPCGKQVVIGDEVAALTLHEFHNVRIILRELRQLLVSKITGFQAHQLGFGKELIKDEAKNVILVFVRLDLGTHLIGGFPNLRSELLLVHLSLLIATPAKSSVPRATAHLSQEYRTPAWEQRKLEDYVVVSTAKNVDGRFNKEDVLSVSGEYGIVNQIAFQGRSFAGSSVLNYGIVNTGDIVYTKSPLNSNPYGIIKVNKGIPGIVSTLYAVYRPQDNVHTNFIQVYFEQHERMNNYMHPLVNKGAKNDMKVTAENALKGVVTFPSREEQVIISEFFDRLDSLITLHQRKYDGCANPLFLERRISCRKPSHQNRCSATTTPSG